MHFPRTLRGKLLAAALMASILIQSVHAQTWTWDGGAGSANWTLPLNWSPDTVPVNNGTANLIFSGGVQTSPNTDTAWNINSLAFSDTASAFTLSGLTLTIRGGGITNNSSSGQTISNAIVLGAAQTWNSIVSPLTLNGAVNNGGSLLTLDGSGQFFTSSINGSLSGAGGLTKTGSTTWYLSGATANTYTGVTTVQQGTLYLNKTVADGATAGNVVVGDNINTAGTATLSYGFTSTSQIANTASVTVNSSGVVDFNGAPETINNLTINGGSIVDANVLNVNGSLVMTGGSIGAYTSSTSLVLHNDLTVNASTGGATISAPVNLGGGARIFAVADGVAASDLSVTNTVSGGSMVKNGAGTLRLTSSNTFAGGLTLNDGTLSLGNNQAAGVGPLVLNSGVVQVDPNSFNSIALANAVVLGGNLSLATGSSYPLTFSGPVTLTGDRTLTILAANTFYPVTFSGAINDGGSHFGMTKLGAGTLVLSGANTFSGALNINEGTLKVGDPGAFGSVSAVNIAAAATFDLNGVALNARPLTLGAAAVLTNGSTTAAGFNGAMTLSGAAIVRTASGAITLGGDIAGNNNGLTVDSSSNVTLNGALALGAGGLTKIGSSTLFLNGNNTYAGTTTITAGTVKLGHPNALGDTAAGTTVGSGAVLDLNGIAVGAEPVSITSNGFGSVPLVNGSANAASLAGTLTLLNAAAVQAQAGNLTLSGGVTSNGLSLTVDGAFNTTISGPLNLGAGSLSKLGTGILTLSAPATYSGATTVSVGTLRLAAGSSLPSGSATTVNIGATFDLNGNSALLGSLTGGGSVLLSAGNALTVGSLNTSTSYTGVLSGAGALFKTGTGTLTLSGSNSFTGGTTISNGTLIFGNASALGPAASSVTVNNGGALDLNGQTFSQALTLNGAGFGTNGALSNNGTAAASVSGAVMLGSASTIKAGTSGSITLAGAVTGNATLTVDGTAATTLSGPLNLGAGGLVKNGTGTVLLNGAQASAYSGVTTVNAGTLALANTGGAAIPGDVVIGDKSGSADTVRLDLNSQIASTSNVSILSSGVLDLNGASNSLASVTVAGGVIAPGSGALSTNALTFTAGSISSGTGVVTVATNLTVNASASTVSIASAVNVGGQVLNQSGLALNSTLTAGNGFLNNGTLAVALGAQLTANGSGLDNEGSLTLSNGAVAGSGPMVNNSAITGFGTIGGSGGLTNNAQITQSGGSLILSNTGANVNMGVINLAAASQFRLTGSSLANAGTLNLNGGVVAGTAQLSNNVGGVINAGGTITAPFANNGGSLLVSAATLNITQAFSNSGVIQLGGGTSNLVGGQIANTGTIQGLGSLGNAVVNSGLVAPQGGGTLIVGGAMQNASSGLVRVAAGNVLLASSGLSTNAGVISLTGGTFDNNGKPLSNTGQISGYGTFAVGGAGLSNSGSVTLTGGVTTVNGNITNASAGSIRVSYNPAIFTGSVVNNGLFKTTSTTTTFAGTFTNNGIFASDPATQIFTDLSVTAGGALQGGEGDVFIINGNLTNYSAQAVVFDLSAAKIAVSGAGAHTLAWPGADLGLSGEGYRLNFAVGELELAAGAALNLADGDVASGGALYVFTLRLDGGVDQIQSIAGNGLSIYYDPNNTANAYLNNGSYALAGGGMIAPVPEPGAIVPAALGALACLWVLRRRSRI